jgi:hypothetical protein
MPRCAVSIASATPSPRPHRRSRKDRALPVDRDLEPWVDVGEWVGDHVRGRERDPVERAFGFPGEGARLTHPVRGEVPTAVGSLIVGIGLSVLRIARPW